MTIKLSKVMYWICYKALETDSSEVQSLDSYYTEWCNRFKTCQKHRDAAFNWRFKVVHLQSTSLEEYNINMALERKRDTDITDIALLTYSTTHTCWQLPKSIHSILRLLSQVHYPLDPQRVWKHPPALKIQIKHFQHNTTQSLWSVSVSGTDRNWSQSTSVNRVAGNLCNNSGQYIGYILFATHCGLPLYLFFYLFLKFFLNRLKFLHFIISSQLVKGLLDLTFHWKVFFLAILHHSALIWSVDFVFDCR